MSSDAPPPPPSGQTPPGWYPDPQGSGALRWWDGGSWSEHVHSFEPGSREPSRSDWLGTSIRVVSERSGHIFPLGLFLLGIPSALMAVVSWWAIGDTVVSVTSEPEPSFAAEGFVASRVWVLAAAGLAASLVSVVFGSAVRQQAVTTRAGVPRPWVSSLTSSVKRFPRLTGVWLGLLLVYLLAAVVGSILIGVAAVIHPALILLAFPLALAGLVFVAVRVSLVASASSLAPRGASSWRSGLKAASRNRWDLLLRGFILLSLTMVIQMFMGSLLAGMSGGGSSNAAFGATSFELSREDLLAPSLVSAVGVAIAGSIFSAFLGAFRSAGFGFVYQDRGGPVDAEFLPVAS